MRRQSFAGDGVLVNCSYAYARGGQTRSVTECGDNLERGVARNRATEGHSIVRSLKWKEHRAGDSAATTHSSGGQ